MMKQMSMSFCMGDGDLCHNLRITRGHGIRQNGKLERRSFNWYVDADVDLVEQCKTDAGVSYEREILRRTLSPLVLPMLNEYNERQTRSGHPERMLTLDSWLDKRAVASKGKSKGKTNETVISEYIVQVGDRITGSAFEYEMDSNGNPVDENGQRIHEWETNKKLSYRNKKVTEANTELPAVYKEYYQRFTDANPNFFPVGAYIHGDEDAGWHMHIDGVWVSPCKQGIGIGLGESSGMKQQFLDRGIRTSNNRKRNAMSMWRDEMYNLLIDVCHEHGIERLDMECKRGKETIPEFKRNQDRRSRLAQKYLEEREAELKDKEYAINSQHFSQSMTSMEQQSKQHTLDAKEKRLASKEQLLKRKELSLAEKETSLTDKSSVLAEQERKLRKQLKLLADKEKQLADKEQSLAERRVALENDISNMISAAEVKAYLRNHYNILKEEFPQYFAEVHQVVVKRFAQSKEYAVRIGRIESSGISHRTP